MSHILLYCQGSTNATRHQKFLLRIRNAGGALVPNNFDQWLELSLILFFSTGLYYKFLAFNFFLRIVTRILYFCYFYLFILFKNWLEKNEPKVCKPKNSHLLLSLNVERAVVFYFYIVHALSEEMSSTDSTNVIAAILKLLKGRLRPCW